MQSIENLCIICCAADTFYNFVHNSAGSISSFLVFWRCTLPSWGWTCTHSFSSEPPPFLPPTSLPTSHLPSYLPPSFLVPTSLPTSHLHYIAPSQVWRPVDPALHDPRPAGDGGGGHCGRLPHQVTHSAVSKLWDLFYFTFYYSKKWIYLYIPGRVREGREGGASLPRRGEARQGDSIVEWNEGTK